MTETKKTPTKQKPAAKKAPAKRKAPAKKMGRPERYSEKLADELLGRLACGESVRTVCLDPNMPAASTIYKWMREREDFSKRYARAKEDAAESLAEEMFDIADDGSNDWMEKHDKEGNAVGYQLNGEHVQRSKLRVDTRKWYLSKIKPKKYGDKITHAGDQENPVSVIVRGDDANL